jgi:dihydropteroate synthase
VVPTDLRFDWGSRTYVLGILNATPDSFSGDGIAGDVVSAVALAERMREEGADVIDVGAESTRPGHVPVAAAEELRRVEPVVRALVDRGLPISVDTSKAVVARRALQVGVRMVNDVSGLADAEMAPLLAETGAFAILMDGADIRGAPDPVAAVHTNLERLLERALRAGISRERIILDPGFGFGKGPLENLAILRDLQRLRALDAPLLVGTSRKSTIGKVLGGAPPDERIEGTAATVAIAITKGVDAIRVHDVREMARVARMADAIVRGWEQ